MVNYANGKIYKIESVSGIGEVYIGSTTKKYLFSRFESHRHDYQGWKLGCKNYTKISSFEIFDKFGIDNCHIILLETCPCGSVDELRAIEAGYIKNTNCVNKSIPGRTKQQYHHEHKAIYKEQRAVRVVCECGSSLSHATLTRHKKTEKHISTMAAIRDASLVPTVSN